LPDIQDQANQPNSLQSKNEKGVGGKRKSNLRMKTKLLVNLIAAKAFYEFYDERQAYYRDARRQNDAEPGKSSS
jgi:hypothetical protein